VPSDRNAYYNPLRDVVEFTVVMHNGKATRAVASGEALADCFRCQPSASSLLTCYDRHWARLHKLIEQKLQRGLAPVIKSADL
jgi:hypothetical protein